MNRGFLPAFHHGASRRALQALVGGKKGRAGAAVLRVRAPAQLLLYRVKRMSSRGYFVLFVPVSGICRILTRRSAILVRTAGNDKYARRAVIKSRLPGSPATGAESPTGHIAPRVRRSNGFAGIPPLLSVTHLSPLEGKGQKLVTEKSYYFSQLGYRTQSGKGSPGRCSADFASRLNGEGGWIAA